MPTNQAGKPNGGNGRATAIDKAITGGLHMAGLRLWKEPAPPLLYPHEAQP